MLKTNLTTDPKAFFSKYRPGIDGLRAIAILCVVGFHASERNISGGFIGVDVFIVISGFLISSIIFNHLENGDFNYLDFIGIET